MQTWFTSGTVIAYGDLAPPIAPGDEYRSHWNNFATGEGSASFQIVALPYFEGLRIAELLGLGPGAFQRLWLSALFAGSSVATVFFAFGLFRSPLAAASAGLLATFNGYRLVSGADSIPLVALILATILGGLILRAGLRGAKLTSLLAFVLASASLGFVFGNPPHLALVLVWLVASLGLVAALGGASATWRALRFIACAAPFVLVVNAWWLVPAFLTVLEPGFGGRFVAEPVDAWAWTHQRASVPNALALNTTWGWSHPEYFPFSAQLDREPFAQLRYAPFALALAGLLVARRYERRVGALLVGVIIAGVLVAKGLHEPLSGVNSWLYEYVPGFWLFRDPAKVLLLVSLAFALLGGLAVARLASRGRLSRPLGVALAAIGVGATLVSTYPLLTGDVIPDRRPLLPPAHVSVSPDWSQASRYLNEDSRGGKVVILPSSDFYQLPTTWGYYGVSFSRLSIDRPVIESAPGGYFAESEAFSRIVASLERDLLAGRAGPAVRKLSALGAGYVLLRRDLNRKFPGRSIANPDELARGLARIPNLRTIRFGDLTVYRLMTGVAEVTAAAPSGFVGDARLIPEAIEALTPEGALVTDEHGGAARLWSAGGTLGLIRVGSEPFRRVSVRTRDDGLTLRLTDATSFRVGDRRLPFARSETIRFRDVAPPAAVTVGTGRFVVDDVSPGWTDLGTTSTSGDLTARLWTRESVRMVRLGEARRRRNCDLSGNGTDSNSEGSTSLVQRDGMATLRLRTGLRATCVSYQIAPLRPNGLHRISFEYRRLVGETPRVCLWQDGPERCASLKPLSGSSSWQRFDELIPSAAGTHGLRLVFFADPSDKRITIAEYRDIAVSRYRWGGSRSIRQSDTASLGRLAVPAGTLSVTETSPTVLPTQMALHAPGAVGDCNRFDSRTPAQLGLSASSVERDGIPTIRLTARDHSACVSYPMGPFESERPYELRLDYRGVSGSRPRVCVWEDGPDRCAALPELDGSAGWHRFEGTIWPTPETERIELFLYADGLGDRETVTEYRNVTVVPKRSLGLIGMPTARRVPEITYERTSPSEFRVQVTEATEPFLLVVTEAFAPGWRVEEVEDRQLSEPVHVVVNGYANGWLIPWRGTYTVRVVYGPEEYASAARRISLIAFLVACAAVLGLIAVRARQVFLRRRNESARLAKA